MKIQYTNCKNKNTKFSIEENTNLKHKYSFTITFGKKEVNFMEKFKSLVEVLDKIGLIVEVDAICGKNRKEGTYHKISNIWHFHGIIQSNKKIQLKDFHALNKTEHILLIKELDTKVYEENFINYCNEYHTIGHIFKVE